MFKSLKYILAFIGLCAIAPGIYYQITTNDSHTTPRESASGDDRISKLPILATELSSVIVISISGVRGKPLPFRAWLQGVYRNPKVESI
ncbi:MAG: hypothetical protein ABSC06_29880, partial [Rhodopila sp.]